MMAATVGGEAQRPAVIVALLTPFAGDGRPDPGALAEHVAFLVEAGVDGLMPCGTTGEGVLLDEDEVVQVTAATVQAAGGRVPVLAHVGRAATQATVRLARRALAEGAAGVSALVPFFYSYTEEQVLRHFRALLAATRDAPAYAYVIPGRTGNDLSPSAAATLAGEGLAGVKDSSKSWQRHLEYLASGLRVLVGTDAFVRDSFQAGSAGCVSALANVRPDLLCSLREGAGEEVQAEILRLREALPLQRLKAALAEQLPGYPTAYRAPLG
jgi:4-hydroxy-tetrahydrodipicolinate synthase